VHRHLFAPVLYAFTDGSDARVHVINVLQCCEFVNALDLSVTALLVLRLPTSWRRTGGVKVQLHLLLTFGLDQ